MLSIIVFVNLECSKYLCNRCNKESKTRNILQANEEEPKLRSIHDSRMLNLPIHTAFIEVSDSGEFRAKPTFVTLITKIHNTLRFNSFKKIFDLFFSKNYL